VNWRSDHRNHVQVLHGPTVYRNSGRPCCHLRPGALLIETWNTGKASVDMEWLVSKKRVDDPEDHAGSCTRWGPDVDGEAAYP
jgi:hypothetical protein